MHYGLVHLGSSLDVWDDNSLFSAVLIRSQGKEVSIGAQLNRVDAVQTYPTNGP